jgi:hypothetical protein
MDLEIAKRLTRELWPPASKGEPGGELAWAIAQTLAQQFSEVPVAAYARSAEGLGWLLFKESLYRAESRPNSEGEGGDFNLRGWALLTPAWRVSLDSHGTMLGLGHPGLVTKWSFSFEDKVLLEVEGTVILRNDPQVDDAERFARLLAKSVGWSAIGA